ncbi:MAG: bifunctional riboflavin kinase/FAD synthetase [Pleurocapsa minor GSE-CHR-MK-17-07R]|nr:bifunctional riboflavin kinase/FAD synthetase [Pleurocapsa minor GSE-CHR-MK 17-07R]
MIHARELESLHLTQPSIVTIGVFDGVHIGHQHLIRQLVSEAHATGRLAVVITFHPHPDVILRGLTGRYYLTTPEERAAMFISYGVDAVVTLPFDQKLREVRADDFVHLLTAHLKLSALWIGSDFALGYKREGNVDFLRARGEALGFSVHPVELITASNHTVTSTGIREALASGDMAQATEWLGRPYSVTGEVVHGQKRGRTIGFPTANIRPWEHLLLPANGIYAGWVTFEGQSYMAATNVGYRPTFNGDDVTVEAYLLDFDADLYGKELTVTFDHRLREEQRFPDINALISQIRTDVDAARIFLEGQHT